ncbi:cobalamin-binding protein [Chloroflexus sp.]|uniref:cobalamin-binding protein n=1 Tax=Chloroflexus sp. TaxID=1904827 RepID=UPI00298F29A7|nr:cobalamin-binding protein [Chloroflexus sp.]MDW8403605.1 cobalamin-binding protein [Chloroflexus sp.]
MRIVSLLPGTTEIVCALGLGNHLVAVSHECDYPPEVRGLPVVTRSLLDQEESSSSEIDTAVRERARSELSIYLLDMELLNALQPDIILTQALCDVCAVPLRQVEAVTAGGSAQVLSFEPTSLAGIFGSIKAIGRALGVIERAEALVNDLAARVERVRIRAAQATYRPRVACLEWLDPVFGPGHWTPELVLLAGGQPVLGIAGERSQRVAWTDVIACAPEVIIAMPCGFTLERAVAEASTILPQRAGWQALPAVRAGNVFAVDGNAYFSRPGPRVVDSLELLAELIHPDLFAGWGPQNAATALR